MKKIFIIVLSYNGGQATIKCLKSLKKSSAPLGWEKEILLVDNGSTDGSLQLIKSELPNLKIIENQKNLGFSRGNNIGINWAINKEARAILILNQDTKVGRGFLRALMRSQADVVAPIISFRRKGKQIYDFGGKINWWFGRTTHLEGKSKRDLGKFKGKADYFSGCCLLIKAPVLHKIGLFDEKFFLYFEDVDFCLRAKKARFKLGLEPKAIVLHDLKEGAEKPLIQRREMVRSNFIFINKYLPFPRRILGYLYLGGLVVKLLTGGKK